MRMFRVEPVGGQSIVGVMNLAAGDALLSYHYMYLVWLFVYKQDQSESAYYYKYAEDHIAEDYRGYGNGGRNNAYRPEPVRASLLVLMFISIPFNLEGRWFLPHSLNCIISRCFLLVQLRLD